jgi:hypothetical protein
MCCNDVPAADARRSRVEAASIEGTGDELRESCELERDRERSLPRRTTTRGPDGVMTQEPSTQGWVEGSCDLITSGPGSPWG